MTHNPNDAPGLGGAGAELDLEPIKALLQEYYDKYAWAGARTEQLLEGIAALVTEVERLRREVNTMAMVDYMQDMNEVGYITREFEPPYPDVWDGK